MFAVQEEVEASRQKYEESLLMTNGTGDDAASEVSSGSSSCAHKPSRQTFPTNHEPGDTVLPVCCQFSTVSTVATVSTSNVSLEHFKANPSFSGEKVTVQSFPHLPRLLDLPPCQGCLQPFPSPAFLAAPQGPRGL